MTRPLLNRSSLADCLSQVASNLGFGVTPARFLSLIEAGDPDTSLADQVADAWRDQFPLGSCNLAGWEDLGPECGLILAIEEETDRSFVVVEKRGDELFLRNPDGRCSISRRELHTWRLVSFDTGRREAYDVGSSSSAASWFRMAFRAHRAIYRDVMLSSLLVSFLALGASIYTMQVYDRVVPTGSVSTLVVLTVGVVLGIGLEAAARYVKFHLVNRSSDILDRELGQVFFNHAVGMRMDQRASAVGTLAAQLKGFETVRAHITSTFLFVFSDLPFALFFLSVIYLIGGPVAGVPLLLLILAVLFGLVLQRSVERNVRLNVEETNRRNGLLVEALDGAEAMKAMGASTAISERWAALSAAAGEGDLRVRSTTTMATNISQVLQQLSYVGIVTVGSFMVAEGAVTLGALIACSILGGRALGPFSQLPQIMTQAKQAKIALGGLERLMETPVDLAEGDRGLVPGLVRGELRADQVTFGYDDARPHLSLPSLEIRAGERVAVLGPTGSGKTSLLRVLSGMYRPTEGRVYLDNYDMRHVLSTYLRERVRYLPQEVRLFSGTLRENLRFGMPSVDDDELMSACERSGLIDAVLQHPDGLDLAISESGAGLSGGQMQLVALTRVLIGNPQLVLLDEPTSGMDRATERRVLGSLFGGLDPGCSVVIVTHKTVVLEHVDRVIILDQGRVVCDGPRDQVIQRLKQNSGGAS